MQREEIFTTIKDLATELLGVDADKVTNEARFKEDLDADSLDIVEFVMGMEEKFDVELPESEVEGVTTVGQAVDLVASKLA
ncbi:MAG TPA: acyl carrier protein [Acidimicrobiia bacterium]|nr:acyl carrier protein [Acidimicrobiia bacterium]